MTRRREERRPRARSKPGCRRTLAARTEAGAERSRLEEHAAAERSRLEEQRRGDRGSRAHGDVAAEELDASARSRRIGLDRSRTHDVQRAQQEEQPPASGRESRTARRRAQSRRGTARGRRQASGGARRRAQARGGPRGATAARRGRRAPKNGPGCHRSATSCIARSTRRASSCQAAGASSIACATIDERLSEREAPPRRHDAVDARAERSPPSRPVSGRAHRTRRRGDAQRREADRRAKRERRALDEARVAERQAQLAVVERLLTAIRAMDAVRSLTDVLGPDARPPPPRRRESRCSSSTAPSCAAGRASASAARPRCRRASTDDGLLGEVLRRREPVVTADGDGPAAPAFAALPADRAAIAVPLLVGLAAGRGAVCRRCG